MDASAETVGRTVTIMKDDSISRQLAVDAVLGVIPYDEYWLEQVNKAIEALPSAQLAQDLTNGCTDTISRAAAIDAICEDGTQLERQGQYSMTMAERKQRDADILDALPSAQSMNVVFEVCDDFEPDSITESKYGWIPCSERLPENIRPVIVTWKNTDPASYYQYIVGKHFTGTACYKNGKWYWYSSTTEDMLAEYGRYDSEEFDEAIECIAWMPLPEPWEGDHHAEGAL